MTLVDLIEVCEAYLNLGGAVSDQLRDVVVGGEGLDAQNGHALRYIQKFLIGEISSRECDAGEDALDLADRIRCHLEEKS